MAKARSGGGITSNKLVRPGVRGGSPKANVGSPAGAAQIGTVVVKNPTPLFTGKMAAVPLGNTCTEPCGPKGAGRTVYASGTQSRTPPAIPITGDNSQWPDKKG